eukprot:TRINITY_DN7816_c0_g1_i9.p1 TRINITY_DN7816_c0_g1~~TRINITY_DN7816_c0_g1_i9.p1  ORF type:complete len:148 (-),score=45.90 TRINITY_DN7816_c0_g1_i9:68-469(-)
MKLVILFLVLACCVCANTRRPYRPWASSTKCSGKVINFCKKKCSKAECENQNKKEPKRNTNKRNYCRRVKCVKPVESCICPMYHKPVCDEEGNYYDNIECALCEGLDKEDVSPCQPFEIGVIGTEAPGEGVIF